MATNNKENGNLLSFMIVRTVIDELIAQEIAELGASTRVNQNWFTLDLARLQVIINEIISKHNGKYQYEMKMVGWDGKHLDFTVILEASQDELREGQSINRLIRLDEKSDDEIRQTMRDAGTADDAIEGFIKRLRQAGNLDDYDL